MSVNDISKLTNSQMRLLRDGLISILESENGTKKDKDGQVIDTNTDEMRRKKEILDKEIANKISKLKEKGVHKMPLHKLLGGLTMG